MTVNECLALIQDLIYFPYDDKILGVEDTAQKYGDASQNNFFWLRYNRQLRFHVIACWQDPVNILVRLLKFVV